MKFTDKNVLKLIDKLNCPVIQEALDNWAEHERAGRSDLELFAEEMEYQWGFYQEESGTALSEEIEQAKKLLITIKLRLKNNKAVQNKDGSVTMLDKEKKTVTQAEIKQAQALLDEKKRIEAVWKKLLILWDKK